MKDRLVRTRVSVLLVTLGAALLVGVALVRNAVSDESTGASDRAKNEAILRELKPPPGTLIRLKKAEPAVESIDDLHERRIGYATDLEYEVARSVTSPHAVAELYARQLGGWSRHEEIISCEDSFGGQIPTPCKDLIIDVFRKGRSQISVNIDGFEGPRPWGYEVTIMQKATG